jgi:hypothetical protein
MSFALRGGYPKPLSAQTTECARDSVVSYLGLERQCQLCLLSGCKRQRVLIGDYSRSQERRERT